jgi:pimeloyl-ACP methyl ester carboxylesterase
MTLPFSIASAVEGRRATVSRAVSRLSARALYPFDRKTAAGNGALATCVDWPSTVVTPPPAPTDLPPVPVLLFAGAFDLSTPLAEARRELARAPEGELIVLPGGHGQSVFTRCGQRSISRFMAGKPAAVPCGPRR